MLEPPPLPEDPQEECANCGTLTAGVSQCITCQRFICLVCYTTDNYNDQLRPQFFCQTCTEAMSHNDVEEEEEEEVTQLVSDNEEEEPEGSGTNDQDEDEYAPSDEAEGKSSEEERSSRGGTKKKDDEVGSDDEHEFDDGIGRFFFFFCIVFMRPCIFDCIVTNFFFF